MMRTMMTAALLALGAAGPVIAQAPVPATSPAATAFEAADLYRLSMVTDPVVSPDGRRVIFTRTFFDIGTDRRMGELWLADLDRAGRLLRRSLLVGAGMGASGVAWARDGSRIAFVATSPGGKPQVHVLRLDEGVARPVTMLKTAPSSLAWSPDGTRIAFVAQVDAKPAAIPGMPAKPEGATWAPDPRIVTAFTWRTDSGGIRTPGARHIFTVAADGSAAPTQLTAGDLDQVGGQDRLSWTPDSRSILFSASLRDDRDLRPRDSDLWIVDATPGSRPRQLTTSDGDEGDPQVSPDGRWVAYTGTRPVKTFYAQPELFVMPLAGGSARSVSAVLDRPVEDAQWDGGRLYGLMNDAGVTRVVATDPDRGERPRVVVPEVGGTRLYLPSSGGGFGVGGGTVAYTTLHADRPAGLGLSRGGAGAVAVDFNADWARTKRVGRLEEVRYRSRADGREIQGWVLFPPDFDPARRYPLALEIHGGPNTDYGPMFSITHQLYAARGYIVLFTNPRGSIGYGERFANAIDRAYPGQDHDDLMSGVELLAGRSYVDPKRLFIGGGSGGGVLTLWAIGQEPDRFRAAAALRPVVDWTMQALGSDLQALTTRYWVPGLPWEARDDYWRRSPLSLVGRVRTPTILVTGESDFRTPINQTEAYYQALKLRGIDTVMVRLPEANHGMGRPSQWLQSILTVVDFYDRHGGRE